MSDYYDIVENAATGRADITIYDRIGEGLFSEGMTAKAFTQQLATVTADTMHVHINSPGGSVWDGLAIANALKAHPAHVTTHIDGLAASIASVIALAGDVVTMADGALFMIHDPYVAAQGNAADMRSAADMLDRVTGTLVDTYTAKTGRPADVIRAEMAAETWFTASEAHAAGFVDTVTAPLAAAAAFDLTPYGYTNAPTRKETPTMIETAPVETAVAVPANLDAFASKDDIAAVQRQIAALADVAPKSAVHPLAAFPSLGDYALAVYEGRIEPVNVIADQITTDNPGVIPPAWINDVKGIVNLGRPGVSALGVESAGAAGMTVNWPYFDGDLATLVGVQATEKTDIVSVKVSLKKGSANLVTYAGGSDISYQLIMRSSPAYIDAYLRIMAAAYAGVTDNAFVDALVTLGTASAVDYDLAADTDGTKFRSAVFAASVEVETATGSPASVVLVADDVFAKIGGWSSFVPGVYGTFNVGGTAQASTLAVNVSGLPVIHDRNLAAGSIIVTNGSAASWVEDGPRTATNDVVTKLGRDVAVWGMGATAVYVPKGVVKVTNLP